MNLKRQLPRSEELPTAVALFRYYWPFWRFQDASRGSFYARASAYRHNCETSTCLPTYVLRWSVLCGLCLAIILACERAQAGLDETVYTAVVAGAGLAFTVCFAIVCIFAAIYARLRFG